MRAPRPDDPKVLSNQEGLRARRPEGQANPGLRGPRDREVRRAKQTVTYDNLLLLLLINATATTAATTTTTTTTMHRCEWW